MKTKPEAVAEMPAEQAAELAALEMSASEGGSAMQAAQQEQAPAVDLAGELKTLVMLFVKIAGPAFPSLEKIYTEEATTTATAAVAAVCNKHGWLQDGIVGEYGEEIAAVAICAPLAVATYRGIAADIAAAKAKAKNAPPAIGEAVAARIGADGAVNQATVTFGAPVQPGQAEA